MFEKWFGARITGPSMGTLATEIPRVLYRKSATGVTSMRTRS